MWDFSVRQHLRRLLLCSFCKTSLTGPVGRWNVQWTCPLNSPIPTVLLLLPKVASFDGTGENNRNRTFALSWPLHMTPLPWRTELCVCVCVCVKWTQSHFFYHFVCAVLILFPNTGSQLCFRFWFFVFFLCKQNAICFSWVWASDVFMVQEPVHAWEACTSVVSLWGEAKQARQNTQTAINWWVNWSYLKPNCNKLMK